MQTLAKIILVLTKVGSVGAGAASALGFLPPSVMTWAVIAFGVVSAVKDCLIHIGDILDNGKADDSFKPGV